MTKMDVKKIKQRRRMEILAGLILLALSFFLFYKYFLISLYDSSLNGSEILERTQHTVPVDVKQEMEAQRKLYKLTEIPTFRVPILMYHYVEYVKDKEDKTRIGLNTLPIVLDEQIKTLKQAGYTFMTNAELTDVINGKRQLPEKPILLTFDDGYRDFYTDAYPILKKHNTKATEYVIAGFLNHPNHLLSSQLTEISKDSYIEIGAHTVNHVWLKGKSLSIAGEEIAKSKEMLESMTGKKVTSFAYPYGAFDSQAIQLVKAAGFTSAVSTVPGIVHSNEDKFFLYRLRPGGRTGNELLNWLSQTKFKPF